jgi:FAD:protein FMN transferase
MPAPYAAETFGALGTYAYVATRDPGELPAARRLTEQLLAEVDRTCSRFRDDSDLARVNAAAGHWVAVDSLLVAAVGVAVDAARATDGLVHPLLGRNIVACGYDRDFAALADGGPTVVAPSPRLASWTLVGLSDDAVRIPAGTALDLGATGKAFAADLVAAALAAELGAPALVSIGGDLAVSRDDETPWPIAVSEHPGGPAVMVLLESGGLATSSTRVRRWTRQGAAYHHLLDPRTGLPAPSRPTPPAPPPSCTARTPSTGSSATT